MKVNRNIGQEILDGLDEIKIWQSGEKKLKVTEIRMLRAHNVAAIRHKSDFKPAVSTLQFPKKC